MNCWRGNLLKPITRMIVLSMALQASLAEGDMLLWDDAGSMTRFFGLVESQDADSIRFRLHPELGGESRVFPRDEVVALVTNIDLSRLANLNPGNLGAYRDYAEELASQSKDMQARDLAIRLFLIVAYGSNQAGTQQRSSALRNSAIRNLQALSRNEPERRAFAKLAFLYQVADLRLAEQEPDLSDAMKSLLLFLLKAVRSRNMDLARQLKDQPPIAQAWQRWSTTCRWDELGRIIEQGGPSSIQLERLLKMEVDLLTGQDLHSPGKRADSWAVQAVDHDHRAELIPKFLNVTEYDPQQNVWCNGQWIRPPKQGK